MICAGLTILVDVGLTTYVEVYRWWRGVVLLMRMEREMRWMKKEEERRTEEQIYKLPLALFHSLLSKGVRRYPPPPPLPSRLPVRIAGLRYPRRRRMLRKEPTLSDPAYHSYLNKPCEIHVGLCGIVIITRPYHPKLRYRVLLPSHEPPPKANSTPKLVGARTHPCHINERMYLSVMSLLRVGLLHNYAPCLSVSIQVTIWGSHPTPPNR